MFKKILAAALAGILIVGAVPAYADDNSAAAVESKSMLTMNADDENATEACEVGVKRGVEYTVTIPKHIVLDGSNGTGSYVVNVKGDIAGDHIVSVIPDSSFVMNERGGKASKTAVVSQEKTEWNYADVMVKNAEGTEFVGTDAEGTVYAPISAGEWKGVFTFTIGLNLDLGGISGPVVGVTNISEGYPGAYGLDGIMTMTWDMVKEAYAEEFYDNSIAEPSDTAFAGLTGSLVVGEDITVIDYFGFSGSELTNIILPESVAYVYDAAFSECLNLGKVKLPSGLSYAGSGLFAYDNPETLIVEYDGVTYSSENFDDLIPAFEAHGIDVSGMECGLFE